MTRNSIEQAFLACHDLEHVRCCLFHAFHLPLSGIPSPLLVEIRRRIRQSVLRLSTLGIGDRELEVFRHVTDALPSRKRYRRAEDAVTHERRFDQSVARANELDVAMANARDRLEFNELVAYSCGWSLARLGFYALLLDRSPWIFAKGGDPSDAWKEISIRNLHLAAEATEGFLEQQEIVTAPPALVEASNLDSVRQLVALVRSAPEDSDELSRLIQLRIGEVLHAVGSVALGDWIIRELEIIYIEPEDVQPSVADGLAEKTRNDLIGKLLEAERHFEQFTTTRDLRKLDRAILQLEAALSFAPRPSPARTTLLNRFCGFLWERFLATGSLLDLDRAIEGIRHALEETPSFASEIDGLLNNLGLALSTRFELSLQPEDIEGAIDALSEATADQDKPSGRSLIWWNNHANALRLRFHYATSDPEDLNASARLLTTVVEVTPTNSPDAAIHKKNLANVLQEQLDLKTGATSSEALDRVIQLLNDALSETSATDPDRAAMEWSLGGTLAKRHEKTRERKDLEDAVHHFRAGLQFGAAIRPTEAVKAALKWAQWAFSRQAWDEAAEAYQAGMEASDRVFRMQLARTHQEATLQWTQDLATGAAYSLVQTSRHREAVVALEAGLGRMLSQSLELGRQDLERLQTQGHGTLYQRFRSVSQRLAERGAPLEGLTTDVRRHGEDSLAELVELQQNLKVTVEAIQRLEGLESFLGHLTWEEIASATDLPLVYVFATPHGGLALVVQNADRPLVVALPELTMTATTTLVLQHLQELERFKGSPRSLRRLKRWQTQLEATLRNLGHLVWEPLLPHLTHSPVVMIPVGLLQLLPLHAAVMGGVSSNEGHSLLDRLQILYAPNARSLARAVPGQGSPESLLLVKVAEQPGQVPIPATRLERDLILRCAERAVCIEEEHATPPAVMSALSGADVCHFACHGVANLLDPLESALILGQGQRLTVRDITKLTRTSIRLAVLSACETGMAGIDLPNEAVNLPTALVAAGAGSVISTLWPIEDRASSLLIGKFYQLWLKEGQPAFDAFTLAQGWLKSAKAADLIAFIEALGPWKANDEAMRTVQALSMIPGESRPYSEPRFWAPFQWSGAILR